ncbi:MAG: FAD:protein FMN transferase, partial [Planctomycetes bacterium]|nr:FAD:protein FMN transferase [Planctomycetota bacterium]
MSTRLLRCAAALSLPLMAACERDAQQLRSFGGPTMGSTYEVKFAAAASTEHVRDLVERELAAFDAAFSNWRDDSEIARVNAHRSTEPVEVSARFAAVLQLALRIAAATDGAYDPTLKPLSDLYRQARHDPDAGLSAAALA